MKIYINSLTLTFKKSTEEIKFKDFNYFYGKIGAGKSSIVRVINYCLGGRLAEVTPAMQSEFIEATLNLSINNILANFTRQIHSDRIKVTWEDKEQEYSAIVPARQSEGPVIPNTNIENISDFIFYLSGIKPPKVRTSKLNEDSDLRRMSFRDLSWYCYLDQETIDSDFYHLGRDANDYKRYKSKDVLRYILGFHQEEVSDLELELENLRHKKITLLESSRILNEVLSRVNLGSEEEISNLIKNKKSEVEKIKENISNIRSEINPDNIHIVEKLRRKGRELADELSSLEEAIEDVQNMIKANEKYINELRELSRKLIRMLSARTVLNDVEFVLCPRCTQELPERDINLCKVCGQDTSDIKIDKATSENFERDKEDRIKELESIIYGHNEQLKKLDFDYNIFLDMKKRNDIQLSEAMKNYDSIYLSRAINLEQNKASIEQEIMELEKLIQLPIEVKKSLEHAEEIDILEKKCREKLKHSRKLAEKDLGNLKKLETLFLDCLIQSQVPGFYENSIVAIKSPNFLPQITNPEEGDLVVASFENLGSGGIKTLFKCCFLLAIHRLVNEIKGNLPTFIIIDSPMKNISERENQEIFRGFYQFLYDLSENELNETQFIIVDKEYYTPHDNFARTIFSRYMMPNSTEHPPLIPYYTGE